ncbi:MAG TPA: 2-dehydropantoate 2-reductase [Gaiellaceae bacterium]|nr:2-dehydropantoate 2-reductase [Gaiellaceae bacterium]HET8652566.1 2-dehydropantoate 2-reductase [Gaiellaceae bacterium]
MRHAVLGAGGVGAFVGACLTRAGREVLLVMREGSLERYGGIVRIESALVGDFEASIPAAPVLERPVDVLWVTTKATQLREALERIRDDAVEDAVVVPLLNGLDHVELLRRRFTPDAVLPGSIAIESERVDPGRVRQVSPFAFAVLSPAPRAEELRTELADAGIAVSIGESEAGVLWGKLALLAPLALTTTLRGSALGGVAADPAWRRRLEGCVDEVVAIARADGVVLDAGELIARIETVPPDFRSSMQKDREAGRPTEIDAIGGSVLRAAARHGIDAPTTRALVEGIRAGE